jgi:hypothetical protein
MARTGVLARNQSDTGSFANTPVVETCYVGTLTSPSALPESGPSHSQSGPSIDFDFRQSGPSQEANVKFLDEHTTT